MISVMAVLTTNTLRTVRCSTAVSAFSLLVGPTHPTHRPSKQRRTDVSTHTPSFSPSVLPSLPSYRHRHAFRNAAGNVRLYSSTTVWEDDGTPTAKARLLFLGTPDVAADTLRTLVDASRDENRCGSSLFSQLVSWQLWGARVRPS